MFNKNSLNYFKESNALIYASIYASRFIYYNRTNIKLDFIYYSKKSLCLYSLQLGSKKTVSGCCFLS